MGPRVHPNNGRTPVVYQLGPVGRKPSGFNPGGNLNDSGRADLSGLHYYSRLMTQLDMVQRNMHLSDPLILQVVTLWSSGSARARDVTRRHGDRLLEAEMKSVRERVCVCVCVR